MRYFKNVETLEELRKQYKELLKKYHPDNPNRCLSVRNNTSKDSHRNKDNYKN